MDPFKTKTKTLKEENNDQRHLKCVTFFQILDRFNTPGVAI